MSARRQTTVLFADVTGSMRLYESAGDHEAANAITGCIEKLRHAVEASGGRVVKTVGDEVMALFATAEAAADAAARMHKAMESLSPVAGQKLAIRVGFHAGPVIQRDNDVFGETVNIASRLVEQAVAGQALTSGDTVSRLAPYVRNLTRTLYSIPLRGKQEEVDLCELLWQNRADVTDAGVRAVPAAPARVALRIEYRGRTLILRRRSEGIVVGRDAECDIVLSHSQASRQHCTIERRQGKFILRDHSANGTYVTVEGELETVLHREEFVLRRRGWVAFGRPRAEVADLLQYFCE